MKKQLTILLWVSCVLVAHSQTMNSYLRSRAEQNLQILAKSPSIKSRVKIDSKGISLLDDNKVKPELTAGWSEIGKVIYILETHSYYEMLKMFEHKGTQSFGDGGYYEHYRTYPTDFKDLFVAIDPGHFGGSLEASRLEARIVKIAGGDVGAKEDIIFTEADLAYCTALFLKQKLEEMGAVVMISRPYGAGAIGEDFSSWLTNGGFSSSSRLALKNKDISQAYFDRLNVAYGDKNNASSRNELFAFYKFIDFKARAAKINEFAPNITISIHYNAHDDNKFYGDRYLHPVKDNYNMMFIPGAFMDGELSKQDQKLDFLRLLLSPDLENSAALADYILDEHSKILNVPRRDNVADDSRMGRNVIATEKPGVYARNLVLTRMVRGTVVYGESLLQDNDEEAKLLGKKDIEVYDPSFGTITTSSRTKQVAEAYFNGIVRFLESNKKKEEYMATLKTGSN